MISELKSGSSRFSNKTILWKKFNNFIHDIIVFSIFILNGLKSSFLGQIAYSKNMLGTKFNFKQDSEIS